MRLFEIPHFILGGIANIVYHYYYTIRFGSTPDKQVCYAVVEGDSLYLCFDRLRVVDKVNNLSSLTIVTFENRLLCICRFEDDEFECTIDHENMDMLINLAKKHKIMLKLIQK